jgi:hypothetical protein
VAIRKATTTDDLTKEAEPVAEGYTVVVGPAGIESTVPNTIVEALLDSGYTKK